MKCRARIKVFLRLIPKLAKVHLRRLLRYSNVNSKSIQLLEENIHVVIDQLFAHVKHFSSCQIVNIWRDDKISVLIVRPAPRSLRSSNNTFTTKYNSCAADML